MKAKSQVTLKVSNPIKIGAYDYKIIYVPKLIYYHKILGQTSSADQLIRIDPDTTNQTKAVTLWHEFIEGINDVYGCGLEEENIDRLAQGVTALLQDSLGAVFDWSDIKKGVGG